MLLLLLALEQAKRNPKRPNERRGKGPTGKLLFLSNLMVVFVVLMCFLLISKPGRAFWDWIADFLANWQ